jgi:hypothetical protein
MAKITPERCRQVLIGGIDKLVTHRWLSRITDEENAVLMGCRSVAITNDEVISKIADAVGPYEVYGSEGETVLEGEVQSVIFAPDRKDGLCALLVKRSDNSVTEVSAFVKKGSCDVKIDGYVVDYVTMMRWLVVSPCKVKATLDSTSQVISMDLLIIKDEKLEGC